MKKILLLVGIASYAGASSRDQKLRDAMSNLEQELQLTTTESHEEESSFWPQCKVWAGACAIVFVAQFVGFYLLDRAQAARDRETLAKIAALESRFRPEGAEQPAESDHSAGPNVPLGVPRTAGGSDEKV